MLQRYVSRQITWVDASSPTADEVRELYEEFAPPFSFLEDLTTPVPRAETSCIEKAFKATLHFPTIRSGAGGHLQEVDFIVLKNALISVRYDDIEAIHQFAKEFEVATALKRTTKSANGANVFFALLYRLYGTLTTNLDYIETKLAALEDDIPDGREKEMVFAISDISRQLISFRHALKTHDSVLDSVDAGIGACFGKNLVSEIAGIKTQYASLLRRIDTLFETLAELRDTHFALLTTRQNETMKVLTIMAFITYPLTLFTSMFGMNTMHTPILGMEGDFWIIVTIMSLITMSFFAFFKYKKWM
jgi:magnesium transporter